MFKAGSILSIGYALAVVALFYSGMNTAEESFVAWTNFSLGIVNFIIFYKYLWN